MNFRSFAARHTRIFTAFILQYSVFAVGWMVFVAFEHPTHCISCVQVNKIVVVATDLTWYVQCVFDHSKIKTNSRYKNRPVMSGPGLYDPTSIMNADTLSKCQREGWIKLAIYLLSFFYYLYGWVCDKKKLSMCVKRQITKRNCIGFFFYFFFFFTLRSYITHSNVSIFSFYFQNDFIAHFNLNQTERFHIFLLRSFVRSNKSQSFTVVVTKSKKVCFFLFCLFFFCECIFFRRM